ncbi:DeoR/GlpR family transcriptional regulator of sugar metabolism [Breznakia sp. PF5-3]|uniref:DeoR/GlpR family DNA-binding transcription regulator n=1 Tax=unclassified Breznakia TaxID=2623764 RepID=UPI0024071A8A|nr:MULTISPECIES: DeoR/GlpR family DNA-binding transcription regulator [unclassified Breznakia]MDL2276260.1 DeoR/GlpR family DNA-binding transcription regulator [Breznakia sp. OttesenSCG-928-G09]MDF9824918.1 DeoR/GlpR family transcriptional regulator of sugar metabolism [Breznakia sp. PM6-1]MDF9835583.1 DeoR/GlpR family transcriptional regulator of sugar metabolism [Breznakia sp. PF5-3]MDF9838001.1 DeoR/GlpR family transcriptional regulator of sugar metabolism [Breznakia sp. PFB2-8]MDF9859990.1
MLKEERQQAILNVLRMKGKVIVNDLASEYHISKDTVRRDLQEMENQGLLKRVFGGALPHHLPVANYIEREQEESIAKYQVAKKAISLIQENQLIAIDGSSTNKMIAKLLPMNMKLEVLTNSFPIANELANHVNIKVIVLGGDYLHESMTNVGYNATQQLSMFHPDICFLGAHAIDADFGISVPFEVEISIKQQFIATANQVVVLTTPNRIQKRSKYKVADLSDIDILICEDEKIKEIKTLYSQNRIM